MTSGYPDRLALISGGRPLMLKFYGHMDNAGTDGVQNPIQRSHTCSTT